MFRLVVLLATLVALASSASIPDSDVAIASPFNGRIVGGTVTDISKHPHQISMRYKSCETCSFDHRCGGSIITSKIILTAAHCVRNIPAKRLNVVAGSNVLNGGGAIVPVAKVIWHENYYANVAYENDVAILVLGADLPLNGFSIKPIQLIEKEPAHGATSTVTGWGTTSEGGTASSVLLEVDVPIVSNDVCEVRYGSRGRINESMLCAGSTRGGVDACQGDSGGPLIVGNQLAGIVSWGDGCARADKPGVYADIVNLRSWIDSTISANS